jgi:aspartyl-tRNA(Asn)/glutamyl-tRNA(Gln) amidotransferase subunit B
MDTTDKYESVIGLEVHVELNTKTKIFCGCKNEFGAEPNTYICPSCLGLPGSLPVFNEGVLYRAVKAGLALGCTIAKVSKFDRKNYYYPDLPKAYQISQFDMPIAVKGSIELIAKDGKKKTIGITRLHMEEDAGKLLHMTASGQIGDAETSLVDYNRGGVPLIEIVSEPDMRTPEQAYLYLNSLKAILKFIDVSDCNMEEGSLRCDANVSVMLKGANKFGTKVEIKNMNSFKNVQKALEYEIKRQIKAVEDKEPIRQETRLWDNDKEKTFAMRSKEESNDYRYFPEPDIPPMVITEEYIANIKKELPELPQQKARRFVEEYGLPEYDAGVLTCDIATADYFEKAAKLTKEPKQCSNWIMVEMQAKMAEAGIENITGTKITPEKLSGMIKLIKDGTISGKIAKTVFEEMFKTGGDAAKIVKDKGLVQISDTGAIEKAVDAVIAANAKVVEEIKGGKAGGIGFLVGQVMKQTGGKANPKMVNEMLKKKITG